ncbi:uncharacterized protein LOC144710180 [Wolffia australiana]
MSSGRRAGGGALAPGFRFHPTDEELVGYYLKRKIARKPFHFDAISDIDLYKIEPWDLPSKSRIQSKDTEWYFFSALDKKYSNRSRTNRATGSGYWKTTGKDRPVLCGGRPAGMKKTLVFHIGRAPKGERTNWVMHEYRLEDEGLARNEISQDAFVVCRVFQKRGPGPQNGAQYGAPFLEEEWEEDDEEPTIEEDSSCAPLNLINDPLLSEQDELKQDSTTDDQSGIPGMNSLLEFGDVIDSGLLTQENHSLALLNDEFLELNDFTLLSPVRATDIPDLEPTANSKETSRPAIEGIVFPLDEEPGFSELFLLDHLSTDEKSFLEINDILGYELGQRNLSAEPKADDEGPLLPESDSHFLDSLVSSSGGPDMVDELMAYFDATENLEPSDLVGFEAGSSDVNALRVNRGDLQLHRGSLQNPESTQDRGMGAVDKLGQAKGGFSARLISMLGAISSPPALAAEKGAPLPKEAMAGFSQSPVRITSAMAQTWMVPEKSATSDMSYFLAYGGSSCEFEKLGKASGGLFAFIQRNSFHLIFLSVLLLAASFKICICVFAH